jgi:hypothetical protein
MTPTAAALCTGAIVHEHGRFSQSGIDRGLVELYRVEPGAVEDDSKKIEYKN